MLAALRFGTLAIPFTPLCLCLSEETLKTVGPFYLLLMPGEVKDPHTGGKCVICRGLQNSEINHSRVSSKMECLAYTYLRPEDTKLIIVEPLA